MDEPLVMLDIDGSLATITLSRPQKLNALTPDMLTELEQISTQLEQDPSVHVIAICGAGRAFCVGADIHEWAALDPQQMWRRWIRNGHRVFQRIADLPQPVIASIHGFAFGGGLELALAADLRIASDDAVFALPETSLATVPGWGGTQRLPKLIGAGRAKRMIFTGDRIDAATAERWGLVEEIVPADQLMARTIELATRIAKNAPISVQIAKQVIDGGPVALEGMGGALSATTEDAQEGLAAFRQRREAKFTGR